MPHRLPIPSSVVCCVQEAVQKALFGKIRRAGRHLPWLVIGYSSFGKNRLGSHHNDLLGAVIDYGILTTVPDGMTSYLPTCLSRTHRVEGGRGIQLPYVCRVKNNLR